MTGRYSIAEASRNLSRLVHEAERGKTMELTRSGASVVILISRRRFEQLTSHHSSFAEAYRNFAESVDLAELNLEPDDLFSGVRADTQRRDVHL